MKISCKNGHHKGEKLHGPKQYTSKFGKHSSSHRIGTLTPNPNPNPGLEKVSFHSNPKERQCQRMLKLPQCCTHLTR